MSKSKAQVSATEKTSKLPEKSRSVSLSRRESPASKGKLKPNDDAGVSISSTDKKTVSGRKPVKNDSVVSKEPISKVSQKKLLVASSDNQNKTSTQSKPLPSKSSKQASVSKPRVENKVALKSRSDNDGSSKSHSKEQHKVVDVENPAPRNIKPKIKANEVSRSSPRNTDHRDELRRPVKQEGKSALPSKPTSRPIQPDKARLKEDKGKILQPAPQNAESVGGEGVRLSRERTKTQTLSPEDSQLMTTLKHVAQHLPQDVQPDPSNEVENDYEDDFEDYESDFEEAPSLQESSEDESDEDISRPIIDQDEEDDDKENYDYGDSSSSLSDLQPNKDMIPPPNGKVGIEENKMDSGHYDLAEEKRKLVHVMLDSRKAVPDKGQVPLMHVSSKIQQKEDSNSNKSFEVKVINFAQAKRRQQERKASSKIKHRGEILLNMIRLDSISLPLLDKAPVPYDVYMRSYGRANTIQVFCQTNDDRMMEEAQTDEINTKNKWTQHPPSLVQLDDSVPHPRICASSSDPCDTDDLLSWRKDFKANILELENFILNTGQLMLSILEETSSGASGLLKNNKADLGFSQGFISVGTDSVPFLNNRKVSRICFVPNQPNSLLTVHLSCLRSTIQENLAAQMVNRCILCMWSLLQPSQPLKILVTNSDVTSCVIHPYRSHLLFAGLLDGVLNVWDLKDQFTFQSGVFYESEEWKLVSPSYATVDYLEVKHSSAVVGVQVLDSATEDSGRNLELSPTQICSLDESGLCIIWTLLSSSTGILNLEDAGIAPWGCIRLLQNESFSLTQRLATTLDMSVSPNLQFADLALDSADTAHLLAATNTGHVAHSLSSGSRAHPALYQPDWDCLSPAICICSCPFGLPYFLVGCGDGTVRLHSRQSARPLLSVAGPGGAIGAGPAIASLQWSNCRPCVFFALDSESRLHVWDLASSDMYPMLTIPFKGKFITTMQLSPTRHTAKACPYLALGTSCGKLKVHLVKEAFASTSMNETAVELDKFKRYVSIL